MVLSRKKSIIILLSICTKGFFYKTIEGLANHWNVNNLNFSRIYLWN